MTRQLGRHDSIEDQEFVDRLRATYQRFEPHQPTLLLPPSRRRRVGKVVLLAAAAAVVAAVPVAGTLVAGTNEGGQSNTSGSHDRDVATNPQPTPGGQDTPATQLIAQIYAALDSRPALGFYMLRATAPDTLTLWSAPGDDAADLVRPIAEADGYSLVLEKLPPTDTWSEASEQKLSSAADQMRVVLAASPASGFTSLKLEVPLNTLVLWRTTPDGATDAQLERIAEDLGVTLELLTGRISRADAEQLGTELRAENEHWHQLGFTVNGAYATGSGAVVVVRGDAAAARTALLSRSEILAIELDDGVPLVGKIHT